VLAPGTRQVVPAERDLVIRTGDAGAIAVSIAGQPAIAMGSNGRVLSRRYSLSGPASDLQPKTAATTRVPPGSPTPEPVRVVPKATEPLRLVAAPPAVGPVPFPPAATSAPARASDAVPDSDRIAAAARRWLAAYTRGDRGAVADLTAPAFELLDERPVSTRVAANQQAERSLSDATVSVSGDGAVLSARMTERIPEGDPSTSDRTAYISQVWIRQSGSWRLLGVRIRSADQVERMFKR
jgi:ketosteroid isomerase-like protein